MSLIQTLLAFILALGVLIVVHEYGHYVVARLCGVKVLRFSVGFGRTLLSRTGRDGTQWVVAAIPFGGYVKMLDEREGDVDASESHRAFNRQNVWRRIAIVLAGPAFNFLFAILAYASLYLYGVPEAKPLLGAPASASAAARAGLMEGDLIVRIGERAVVTWQEFRWAILQSALQGEAVELERQSEGGNRSHVRLDLGEFRGIDAGADLMGRIGLRLFRPALAPVLGNLLSDGAGHRDGLMAGDEVLRIGETRIDRWSALVDAVRSHPAQPIRMQIRRGGQTIERIVTPDAVVANGERIGRIGAAPHVPATHAEKLLVRNRYGVIGALGKAIEKTVDIAVFSLRMLGRMLIGQVSWKHLSGPVTIADYAGQSAQLGWLSYLTFLALVSISLGVLNLLPIPLLDGGHLMYYAVEILIGRPVSERVMEIGQRVGLSLLLVMMAFAFYNDLTRLFQS